MSRKFLPKTVLLLMRLDLNFERPFFLNGRFFATPLTCGLLSSPQDPFAGLGSVTTAVCAQHQIW